MRLHASDRERFSFVRVAPRFPLGFVDIARTIAIGNLGASGTLQLRAIVSINRIGRSRGHSRAYHHHNFFILLPYKLHKLYETYIMPIHTPTEISIRYKVAEIKIYFDMLIIIY
jgi:hypothetical protein